MTRIVRFAKRGFGVVVVVVVLGRSVVKGNVRSGRGCVKGIGMGDGSPSRGCIEKGDDLEGGD